MTKQFPIIDLHTDFILGEAKLGKKLFDIETSTQINKGLLEKTFVSHLFAGFSYDNEKDCTEIMLSSMEKFSQDNKTKFKIIFHLEGAEILAKDVNLLDKLYKRGVRSIGLAHTHDNSLCGSSSGESKYGLTKKGISVINKCLTLNILIDLAHMSNESINDTFKILNNKPPILSHTACFAIEPNPRNTTDIIISKIAKRGGVIGVFFSGKYINSKNKPTLIDVVDHIEHIIKVGGVDCAAIGSDFGGITTGTPLGLESTDKLTNIFTELKRRGYTNQDIEKIAYKNAQRVINNWNPSLLK